jgi:hypothetical protein
MFLNIYKFFFVKSLANFEMFKYLHKLFFFNHLQISKSCFILLQFTSLCLKITLKCQHVYIYFKNMRLQNHQDQTKISFDARKMMMTWLTWLACPTFPASAHTGCDSSNVMLWIQPIPMVWVYVPLANNVLFDIAVLRSKFWHTG